MGKATLFNNHTQKQTTTALPSQESKDTIDDFSHLFFDLLSLVLNVALNIIVIAFVLDIWILWAYGIGMVLSFLLIYRLNSYINNQTTIAQNERLNLIGILHKAWDNVLLNNAYNYQLFYHKTQTQFKITTQTNLSAEKVRYLSATLGMLILMLPVLGVSLYLFKLNWHNNAILAILIATLPRQVQLLQMCYSLISYHIGIAMIKARITGLLAIFDNDKSDLTPFIKYDKIKVLQTGLIFDKNNLPKTGRMTLIGNNGVGKSSLLLTLKQKFGDTAYYLPVKHQLEFACNDNQGSTGQNLIRQLQELKEHFNDKIWLILLDEWDAHLDNQNRTYIDTLIETLCQAALVIEVRHRQA